MSAKTLKAETPALSGGRFGGFGLFAWTIGLFRLPGAAGFAPGAVRDDRYRRPMASRIVKKRSVWSVRPVTLAACGP